MRAPPVIAMMVLAACGGSSSGTVDAPAGDIDAAPDDAPQMCTLPDAPAMCDPAAKPLPNPSCLAEAPGTGGCPPGMVRIEGFCIDRYEAHLVTRGAGGELTPHEHFRRPEEGVAYEARSAAGVFPQAYISRVEAKAACAAAGKRLCSRKEWQRACQGARGAIYPYGEHWEARRCNTDKQHLITLRFGADPRRWHYDDFNDPTLAQEPGFLARTGAYQGCVGEAGVYDLVGNLHEWVSDTVDQAFVDKLEAEPVERKHQGWREGNGVFMGGFYGDAEINGAGCNYETTAHAAVYHDYSTGFRCCMDPEQVE